MPPSAPPPLPPAKDGFHYVMISVHVPQGHVGRQLRVEHDEREYDVPIPDHVAPGESFQMQIMVPISTAELPESSSLREGAATLAEDPPAEEPPATIPSSSKVASSASEVSPSPSDNELMVKREEMQQQNEQMKQQMQQMPQDV